MRAFFRLFYLDTSDPELMRAQFSSFQGHIPLLYVILVCNTVAITVTSFNAAALVKTLLAPIAISSIAMSRAIWWLRQGDTQKFSDAELARHLWRTCLLACRDNDLDVQRLGDLGLSGRGGICPQ